MPSANQYPRSSNDLSLGSSLETISEVDHGQFDQRMSTSGILDFEDTDTMTKSSIISSGGLSTTKKKRRRNVVTACTSATRYDLVRRSMEELGMVSLRDEDTASHAYLVWCDSAVQADRIQELKSYQHINHFPGMAEICRKDYLARNMAKMSRARPDEYHFIPRTWILPSEYNLLVLHWRDLRKRNRKPPTFIMKPANGAMGNGIHLFRNPERLVPHEHMIVQEYLDRPFLLDDYKIDLRLYVLVTHCDPLRAFLYRDGLVRLGTEKYASPSESNVDSLFMHLTNYSVNKYNEKFERHADYDRGSKRSVKSFMNYLRTAGYDTTTLWRNIIDLLVKTLIVVSPHILHSYRMSRPGTPPHADSVCFEVLGFDIFLDRKLKPWLLEVNRSPSFGTDERVDYDIKSGVVKDALRLLNIRSSDKSRNLAQQKLEAQKRLLRPSHKRLVTSSSLSTAAKRKLVLNRRKEELKERLIWARKDSAREEYENKNMNNYMRIFPSPEKQQQDRYLGLLQESFSLFLQSRSAPFQKNIIDQYKQQKEDEILDLLEQCESEEVGENPRSRQQPQLLSSMPVLSPPSSKSSRRRNRSSSSTSDSSDSSSSEDEQKKYGNLESKSKRHTISKLSPEAERATHLVRHGSAQTRSIYSPVRAKSAGSNRTKSASPVQSRPLTSNSSNRDYGKKPTRPNDPRPNVGIVSQQMAPNGMTADIGHAAIVQAYINSYSEVGRKSKHYPINRGRTNKQKTLDLDELTASAAHEREEELFARTLTALKNTRIKFPGKSDSGAERILDDIMDNWKSHKSRVASYWLIKLDTAKRKKVIDIVRGNVRAVVQRTWIVVNVDSLKIMRTFNRVFNRMHANHGQGLWSCFSTSSNSWETMFSKSSDTLSECEMECCRRIVQLCKDCLLIVYQFASDAQTSSANYVPPSTQTIQTKVLPGSSYSQSPRSATLAMSNHAITRGIYMKPDKPSFSRTDLNSHKSDHVVHVVSNRPDRSPLSLIGTAEKQASGDSTTSRISLLDDKYKNRLTEDRNMAPLSLDDLPKRFTRSLQMPSMNSTYGSSARLTSNAPIYSRQQNPNNEMERSNILSSLQRSKTDVGIKTR
ncbi:tubulin polyglutamylase TTLL7-like [Styela clava]